MRRLLLLALFPLLGCRSSPHSSPSPTASSSSPIQYPSPNLQESLFQPLRDHWIAQAKALEPLSKALLVSVENIHTEPDARKKSLLAYASLRAAYRRLEPLTRVLARVASSQIGAYMMIEPEESGPTGLPALGALLHDPSSDPAALLTITRRIHNAVRLLPGELATQSWSPAHVGLAFSDGTFTLGARLDGSDSFDETERWTDVTAETDGLLYAIALVLPLLRQRDPDAASTILEERDNLQKFYTKITTVEKDRNRGMLAILGVTGRLGAALRKGFSTMNGKPIPPPFRAMHDGGLEHLAPVSVLTFPARTGPVPEPAEVALGKALFHSKLFSINQTLSCSSCHDERHAFAHPKPPPLTFEGKPLPRDAPGLFNVAYETFFLWEGRASTLQAQIDAAVDRDMGNNWEEIVRRVNKDQSLQPLHDRPLTPDTIRSAIVAYERTLIEDSTRLDRHERGEITLSEAEQRGFDLFFGKARCSRCHRLPLLSGIQPPRLIRSELSAIGAPIRPNSKDPGSDTGRHAATHREEERGLFKTPGLRRVAETSPYFHHGGFKTLSQVIDFYEKGGGPGLGVPTPNVDPELAPLQISPAEHRDLLLFLEKSLGR